MKKLLKFLSKLALGFAIFVIGVTIFIRQESDFEKFCSTSEPCDAIVSISGGNTGARAIYAGTIFVEGYAKNIVFSGANSDPNVISDAEKMELFAEETGVEEGTAILEENARNTAENAKLTAEIIKKNGWRRVILSTSPYHQRRAVLEFRKALEDYEIEIFNAPAQNDKEWRASTWVFSKRGWYLTMSEFIGIIMFYLR